MQCLVGKEWNLALLARGDFQEAGDAFRLTPGAPTGPPFICSPEMASAGFQEDAVCCTFWLIVLRPVDQQTAASALPPREPTGPPRKTGGESASHPDTEGVPTGGEN